MQHCLQLFMLVVETPSSVLWEVLKCEVLHDGAIQERNTRMEMVQA